MIIMSLRRKVKFWIKDAMWLYDLKAIPDNVETKAYLSGLGWLERGDAKQAKTRVFTHIAAHADKIGWRWEDIVKQGGSDEIRSPY